MSCWRAGPSRRRSCSSASGITNPHLGRHVSGNADLPIAAFLAEPTDVYQGVVMDTVTFDFLRPETTGPHAADKFIVISQHMLPLSTLVSGHGAAGPPDSWGLAKKHRYRDFGRHFVGLAVIGLDEQEGTIEGPEVHATDGVRLAAAALPGVADDRGGVGPRQAGVRGRGRGGRRHVRRPRPGTRQPADRASPRRRPDGGTRRADGVVDPDGFVHGVEGLSVLDGAIVPSALGVNPSLTIAALVERAMTNRVTALDRPDAADLRPADVLAHRIRRRSEEGSSCRRSVARCRRARSRADAARRARADAVRRSPIRLRGHRLRHRRHPRRPATRRSAVRALRQDEHHAEHARGVDFLAAEPTRVTIIAGKCSYWQQDHWVVRLTPDTTPIVEWEGSYWYDARTGTAAGIVRNFRIAGQPVDGYAFADSVEPFIGQDAADQIRPYSAEGGGGGASFALPQGLGEDVCPSSTPE